MEWYDFPEALHLSKYQINKLGEIRHKRTQNILSQDNRKYRSISINPTKYKVHVLMVSIFFKEYNKDTYRQ